MQHSIRTDWLERWALYAPERVAVKDDATGRPYTYRDLHTMVRRLSNVLRREYGLRHGDRVAVLSMNCVEYLLLAFAVQHAGAVIVPVNFRLTPNEIEFILSDSRPSLLVYQTAYQAVIAQIDASVLPPRSVPMALADERCIASYLDDSSLPTDAPESSSAFTDPCMILYTSGTTGHPKGAIITNEMVFWNSVNTTMRLNITESDVALTFAPFFHTGGWHVLTTPFLHRGARIVMLNGFNADRVVELCDTEKVTILFGVPTMMTMMSQSERFGGATFASVRFAIVGGEPMPIPQIELWQAKGVPIRQGYGLTEVGPNCFSLPEEDAVRKKGSIGFPNFYIETRIVDDDGQDALPGAPGELLLKSPVVSPGYWNNAEATEKAIEQGWFHTGDIVRKDEEGYYYVVDRKKDMFISGAENVYPAEIERLLYAHPAVQEAAVIGVPDPKWGEVGKAYIVPRSGATVTPEELDSFCREGLAKYKVPKHFEIIAELPKGHSGKVLKRALKDRHTSQLS